MKKALRNIYIIAVCTVIGLGIYAKFENVAFGGYVGSKYGGYTKVAYGGNEYFILAGVLLIWGAYYWWKYLRF